MTLNVPAWGDAMPGKTTHHNSQPARPGFCLRTCAVAFSFLLVLAGSAMSCRGGRATGPSAPGVVGQAPPRAVEEGRDLSAAPRGRAQGLTRSVPGHAGPRRPVTVTYFSPQGLVQGATAVLVTFSQPMTALGMGGAGRFPVEVRPAQPAERRWISGDTAKLAFKKALPFATRFTVTVRSDVESLLGNRLAAPVTWSFETPRVQLQSARNRGALVGKKPVLVSFNQPVSLGELRAKVAVTLDGRPWPVAWRRTKRLDQTHAVLVPARPWPAGGHKVLIRVPKGFVGVEGPLGTKKVQEAGLRTVGPLRITLTCHGSTIDKDERCWPLANEAVPGLGLVTSTPVERAALLAALRVTPRVGNLSKVLVPMGNVCDKGRVCARFWQVKAALKPETRYRIQVASRLRDIYKERLSRPVDRSIETMPRPPGLFLSRSARGYVAPGSSLPVLWRGGDLSVRTWQAADGPSAAALLSCLAAKKKAKVLACLRRLPSKKKNFPGSKARKLTRKIPLPRGLSLWRLRLRPDRFFVPLYKDTNAWDEGGWLAGWRVVQATDMAVHVRATPFDLLAWVTDMNTGKALSGVSVRLWNDKGRMLVQGRSGPDGLVRFAMKLGQGGWQELDKRGFVVTADLGSRKALVPLGAWNTAWQNVPFSWMADPLSRVGMSYPAMDREQGTAMDWVRGWIGDRLVHRGWLGTERRIYRPGEEVFVQGAVRGFRTWHPVSPGFQTASLVLVGPFGDVVARSPVRLGPMGAFETKIRVPASSRLGYYRIELKRSDERLAVASFRLANFMPPTFWVRARVPASLGPGGDIPIHVEARTYAGAAMDRAPVHIEAASEFMSKGFESGAFFAGRRDWLVSRRPSTWYRRDEYLDGSGRLSLTIPRPRGKRESRHFFTLQHVSVQVMSQGGRTQSSRSSLTSWPSDLAVGIRSGGMDHPRSYELAVFGRDGKRRAATVRLRVLPVVGRFRDQKVDWSSTLWSKTVRVGPSGARITIPGRRFPGSWVFVVFSVTDAKGRQSWTTDMREAIPPRLSPKPLSRTSPHKATESLSVSVPTKKYRPGQTVAVTVTRRGKVAEALLILERERIFRVLPIHFGRKTSVTIPIRVEDAHAFSVNVTALATVPKAAYRPGRKSLLAAQGVLNLRARHYALRIQVDPDEAVHGPGDRVGVSVQVTDDSGRPVQAAVILTAVDQAVLALAGSGQTDPLRSLFNVPPVQVQAYDLRLSPFDSRIRILEIPPDLGLGLVGKGSGAGYGYGGLGLRKSRSMAPGSAVRRRFVTTPWQKLLVTNVQGRAHASFVLPDNLTTFRILAVAFDKGRRSGMGHGKVVVTQSLFALANLPRQVRLGDRFLAGVTVYNRTKRAMTVHVSASMSGAVEPEGGKRPDKVLVPAGRSASLRFAAAARRAGKAWFRFDVCGGGRCDRLERSLPVSLPTMMRARSLAGSTNRSLVHRIASLASVLPDRGGLDVRLSSSLLVGLEPGLSKLVTYPFDCSEQSLSKLVGLMAAAKLLPHDTRIQGLAQGKPLRSLISQRIEALSARWNQDGGLPMWPAGASSVWATAYAVLVLDLARRQGAVRVPRSLFERASKFLKRRLKSLLPSGKARRAHRLMGSGRGVEYRPREPGPDYGPRQAGLAALALSRLGEGAVARSLVAALHRRHQDGSLAQRAMLLAALAPWAKSTADRKLLAWYRRKVQSRIRAQGPSAHAEDVTTRSWWPFDSMVRDTALTLLALLALDPNHPMAQRMARWLVLDRKTAEFRTTQDAAWSLMALWAQAQAQKAVGTRLSAGLWLGQKLLIALQAANGQTAQRSAHVPMRRLRHLLASGSGRIVVGSQGKGRVYYTLRLRAFDKKLPLTSEDRGFAVRRTLQRLDRSGRIVSGTPRFGDQVLVTLEVTSREAHRFVAIEDPLPGGLEPVDLQLRTATRNWGLLKHLSGMSRFDHRELRDDRVLFFVDDLPAGKATYRYLARVTTPGRFVWPPARAEEMYAPEVSGHNAATWIQFP